MPTARRCRLRGLLLAAQAPPLSTAKILSKTGNSRSSKRVETAPGSLTWGRKPATGFPSGPNISNPEAVKKLVALVAVPNDVQNSWAAGFLLAYARPRFQQAGERYA